MLFYFKAASRAVGSAAARRPLNSQIKATPRAFLTSRFYNTTIEKGRQGYVIRSDESGPGSQLGVTSFWLRDNCRCKLCVNQDTMQRNFDTFEIPPTVRPAELLKKDDGIDIVWSDGHESHYSSEWLGSMISGNKNRDLSGKKTVRKLWNASIASSPPEVTYEAVMDGGSKEGMAQLTNNLVVNGFTFVIDSPKTPEATKALLESIGPIRNTHYGGFYDFVPDLAVADTAYTNLALAAHTDTTYFTEPAGLQSFHMLSHTPPPNQAPEEALGGQSLLVDGFNVAALMKLQNPELYEILREVKLPWHASGNEGIAIAPDMAYPVIEAKGQYFNRIRWNNDDRGVVPTDVKVNKWYRAAREWSRLLKEAENEYRFQLEPGRILIFDNWRVLHGRTAFEGLRRICGAYVNRDDFISRWKTTNFPVQSVIAENLQMNSPISHKWPRSVSRSLTKSSAKKRAEKTKKEEQALAKKESKSTETAAKEVAENESKPAEKGESS